MGSINIAYGSTGTVTHKNEDIVWGGIYDLEHQTWTITSEADFDLDPVKYYWVYIKSNIDDGTALWYLSESKIQALDVEGYYMFEWGQINPVREGSRILQPAYGSSYKMHNPVTVNPASAAYASIDPATQELTVNEQAFTQVLPIEVTALTLLSTGWTLVSGFYEYDLADTNITATSEVEVIFMKDTIAIVKTADIMPDNLSDTGTVKIYATNEPTADINVTLIITEVTV